MWFRYQDEMFRARERMQRELNEKAALAQETQEKVKNLHFLFVFFHFADSAGSLRGQR